MNAARPSHRCCNRYVPCPRTLTAYAAFFAAFTFAQRFFAPATILAFASGLITRLAFFGAAALAAALPFNFAHRA